MTLSNVSRSGFAPTHGMGCLCCTPFTLAFTRRITADLSRRAMMMGLGASASAVGLGVYGQARAQGEQPQAAPPPTVFTNIQLFDGTSDALRGGLAVIVEGDKVTAIQDLAAPLPDNARVIDGRGGTLMPGLIDAHWHAVLAAVPQAMAMNGDPAYMHIIAAEEAERTVLRGFTTVRDCAGPSFALKRAIDEGQVRLLSQVVCRHILHETWSGPALEKPKDSVRCAIRYSGSRVHLAGHRTLICQLHIALRDAVVQTSGGEGQRTKRSAEGVRTLSSG